MSKNYTAAYLGTFDPLTLGHFDVISRSCSIFHELIVGVGQNLGKNPCFSIEERVSLVKEVCKAYKNIRVESFEGLAVDFASKHRVNVFVRGLRTEADYVYEMQMAMMNKTLNSEIETIFIPTRQDLSHVSSTLIKEVISLGGNVSKYVPQPIYERLMERLKPTR